MNILVTYTFLLPLFIFSVLVSMTAYADSRLIARVYYDSHDDIQLLLEHYDVHEYNNTVEKYVLISADQAIVDTLRRQGWRVEIDEPRTGDMVNRERMALATGYRTIDELYAELRALTTAYPRITELVDYGDGYAKSIGGDVTPGGDTQAVYDLLALRITNRDIPGPKPVFFLMAGIHAREITTPEIALRFADLLVSGYGLDADASWIIDWHETWIVPSVNPEGHWIVELGGSDTYNTGNFSQRKNANQDDGCTQWPPFASLQYGVDLNRNHSYNWNNGGSSGDPCSPTYRGNSAASEPEVSALQSLISSIIPDQRADDSDDVAPATTTGILISLHSYSRLVLWPWGYSSAAPPNAPGLEAIGQKFAAYNGYTPQQGYALYQTSGDSADWAYGTLGIPAFTFELGTRFMPDYAEIDAVQWPTNKPALLYAAKIARTPYQTVHGPDARSLELIPTPSNVVIISAVIDDSYNGNQTIAAAEYYIGTPPWSSNAVSYPMHPGHSFLVSPVEAVSAFVPLEAITDPETLIYLRGRDSQNNWGPVSAVFAAAIPEPALALWLSFCLLTVAFRYPCSPIPR